MLLSTLSSLLFRSKLAVQSPDISRVTLHKSIPIEFHIYTTPFLTLYPLLAFAYYIKYDQWVKSEEWTFIYTVGLVSAHALSFLATRWNVGAKALITTSSVSTDESEWYDM